MSEPTADRRRWTRREQVEGHGILSAFVRPGKHVAIVNVSEAGALVKTCHRLLPGATVELQIEGRLGRTAVRARIVRCDVAMVRSTSVCYRAALLFDRHVPWLSDAAPNGYRVPSTDSRVNPSAGADATRPEV